MEAYSTEVCAIPPLATMPKDHKETDSPVPKTRPVCLCSSSMNGRSSDILSDVLNPIGRERGRHIESESTEESLNYVKVANEKIKEMRKAGIEMEMVIGSMDVEALYPSIEIEKTAVILREMMEEADIKHENIEYETAVKYVAINIGGG